MVEVWKDPTEVGSAVNFEFDVNTLSNDGHVAATTLGGNLHLSGFDFLGNPAWSTDLDLPLDLFAPQIVAHQGTFTVVAREDSGLTRFLTYTNAGELVQSASAQTIGPHTGPFGSIEPIQVRGALDGSIYAVWTEEYNPTGFPDDLRDRVQFVAVDTAGVVHTGTVDFQTFFDPDLTHPPGMVASGIDVLADDHLVVHITRSAFGGGTSNDIVELDNQGNIIQRSSGEVRLPTTPIIQPLTDTFVDGRTLNVQYDGDFNALGTVAVGINDPRGAEIFGTAGDDTIAARQSGGDVSGLAGNDLIQGVDGADFISGGNDNDTLFGGNNADTLDGDAGNDFLDGEDGNDTLYGGAGSDTAHGGDGNDRFIFDRVDVATMVNTVDGGTGQDILDFTGYSDAATTDDLTDETRFVASSIEGIVFGQEGHTAQLTIRFDVQRFTTGDFDGSHFSITGVASAIDTLRINMAGATSFDGAFLDFATWQDEVDFVVLQGGAASETIDGTEVRDTINGGLGNDTLTGYLGRDDVFGESGNDTIIVTTGDLAASGELMDGGSGTDTLKLQNVFATDHDFDLRPHSVVSIEVLQLSGLAANNSVDLSYALATGLSKIDLVSTVPATTETVNIFVTGALSTNLSQLTLAHFQSADRLVFWGEDSSQGFNGIAAGETFNAAGGNDNIEGAGGRDEMHGGEGTDAFAVSQPGHIVAGEIYDGGNGIDRIVVKAGDYNFRNVTLTSIERISFTGTTASSVTIGSNQFGNGGFAADGGVFGDVDGDAINRFDVVLSAASPDVDLSGLFFDQFNGFDIVELFGTDGDNTIIGSASIDAIYGNGGNDVLDGGGSSDGLLGGQGDDTYFYDGTDTIVEFAGQGHDTVIAEASVVLLMSNVEDVTMQAGNAAALIANGNELDNVMIGNDFDNTLSGGKGNDTIDGGFGFDTLDGGDGIDTNDSTFWDGGYVWDMETGAVTFVASGGSESAVNFENAVTGNGNDQIIGTEGDNVITTNGGNDRIFDNGGNDTIDAGPGNDVVIAGDGIDFTDGGDGVDTLDLTFYNGRLNVDMEFGQVTFVDDGFSETALNFEKVLTSDHDDFIDGYVGDETFTTLGGDDRIIGGAGNDTLHGGAGIDTAVYGFNFADYTIDRTAGTITGVFEGTDTLDNMEILQFADTRYLYSTGTLFPNNPGAFIEGTDDADIIDPTQAPPGQPTPTDLADTIFGLAGDDTIDGGRGGDTMIGGNGDDTYYVDTLADLVIEETATGGVDTVIASVSGYTLGNFVENLTLLGFGGFTGTGNELNNKIFGNGSGNLLFAGDGNDIVKGNGGLDEIHGDAGNDTLYGGDDADTIFGGLGNDQLSGDEAPDFLYGEDGNDTLTGGTGDDSLDGGSGIDTAVFSGNLADYTITADNVKGVLTVAHQVGGGPLGIDGIDILKGINKLRFADQTIDVTVPSVTLVGGDASDDVLNGGEGADNLNGLGGNDTLFGFDGVDLLQGGAGNDTLSGGGGNDTLNGNLGADTMEGGYGNDTYFVDNAGDVVSEAPLAGVDTVRTTLTAYTLGANIENLVFIGSGNFTGTGNGLANIINGGAGIDTLLGGGSNDTLNGGGGSDTLNGNLGADTMAGGLGNDTYFVDNAGDVVSEAVSAGVDTVRTTQAGYTLSANVENLTFIGSGNFAGNGNGLANVINGGPGNDTLAGGAGNDQLHGGAGQDSFRFDTALNATTNVDHIFDFSSVDDKILLSHSVFTAAGVLGSLDAGAFFVGAGAHDASDRIIYHGFTGALGYDPDGNGGAAETQSATLSAALALTSNNFTVV